MLPFHLQFGNPECTGGSEARIVGRGTFCLRPTGAVTSTICSPRLTTMVEIWSHTGKTRCWNRRGTCAEMMEELGPEVWTPLPPQWSEEIGHSCGQHGFSSVQPAPDVWKRSDLQCAWQLMLQFGGPRCHQWLRTALPSASEEYAKRACTEPLTRNPPNAPG